VIDFLDIKKFKKGLKPVTSAEMFSKPGEFHPEGLFSESIFGPEESVDRKKVFSFINLNVNVIHPTAYGVLIKLDMKLQEFLSSQETFSVNNNGLLVRDPKGVTGMSEFLKMFPKIKFRGGTADRERFIKKITIAFDEGVLAIDAVPVIPPEQRPAYQDIKGMWVIDELNDYYTAILRKAAQMKGASMAGPLFDLLNYELQKSVLEHDKFIRKLIQKKRGLIRSQLLGKRTDFSGRAVITPGPQLKVNEIGIPLRMAVSLFEPFILFRIFNSDKVNQEKLGKEIKSFIKLELSIDSIRSVFKSIRAGDKMPKGLFDIIFEITEVAMMNRIVLAKRDPALHAESVRPFHPILITGDTVQLCTLQVSGFNADFDGDTMAIYHPITNESQQEVIAKMMKSESGENSHAVNFDLSKEMLAGLYGMTKNVKRKSSPIAVSLEDLQKATDPYIPVKFRGQNTTMGKAIFNSTFPASWPFYDSIATKKYINSSIPVVLEKYGQKQAIETFSALERLGFKFSTILAPSFSLDNIQLPSEILKIKQQLKGASTEEADLLIKKSEKLLAEHLKDTGLSDLQESGAAKGWGNTRQILVAKGIVADPQGKILDPIAGSFADGLTNKEYFEQSAGARRGIIDRVINTADTGYMSRQLAYVTNTVEIDRMLKDCKTKRTLDQRLTTMLIGRLDGRFIIKNGKVVEFNKNEYKVGDVIHLRTPIFCESPKLCHTCYGKLLDRHKSPYAGIIAAQLIGEAGTQTIMRTFHTGGAVDIVAKDIIGDIVQNDPMVTKVFVARNLAQQENSLVAKNDCTITITIGDYPNPGDLKINDQKTYLSAKGLVCRAEFPDVIFSIILDYPVDLPIYEMEQIGKEFYKLHFKKNSTILETSLEHEDMKKQIQYTQRLLSGREIFKDANHLFLKLFRVYGPLRNSDAVHLEVLISQVLRDRTNMEIPARLSKKWDPVSVNMKQIVFKTSFIQGLAFENINEAIRVGLISPEPADPSILEKVLTGTLVEQEKK
jgi:DNA-directed RNA polymerase beta' subunit